MTEITEITDHMQYQEGMEVIDSDMLDTVLSMTENYDPSRYTAKDVRAALKKDVLSPEDYAALLSPVAGNFLEEMAQRAMEETRKHFGNSIYMFTPLYISNYCENRCVYCGFNCTNEIHRAKLDTKALEEEMKTISDSGLEEILILTGESPKESDVKYIGEACKIAKKYFRVIGLEVYPMNSSDYTYLYECGADFVTVFQETYNPNRYAQLHLGGNKRIFPYRFYTQERAIKGGMRGVGLGALLGLSDFRKDAFATGIHGHLLQRKYPRAEIAFSCPRLRPATGEKTSDYDCINERELLQVICAYRIFMPFAGITISSRERSGFRDNVIKIAATKISAGVDVGIGGHTKRADKGDEQFEIDDGRTVKEIYKAIKDAGLQPVMSDYIYV